jgi:hypothetical protein
MFLHGLDRLSHFPFIFLKAGSLDGICRSRSVSMSGPAKSIRLRRRAVARLRYRPIGIFCGVTAAVQLYSHFCASLE